MGSPRSTHRATRGILLDTNLLVYYRLPSQIAVKEQDRILSIFVSLIIDNLNQCGPLIVVEALIDEMKNALRDKLIERGISREAKIKSASRLVEDFREILENLSKANLALYLEEDEELYRRAHWVYENIKKNCSEIIPKKMLDRMIRDSMFIALAGRFNAILVTRDRFLYSAIKCLYSQGNIEYSSTWIHVDPERRVTTVRVCTTIEQPCILEQVKRVAKDSGWKINYIKNC